MNRAKASILLILFPLILLSACSREEDACVTVEYWTHEDSARAELEEEIIAAFEEAHPGVDVIRREFESAELLDIIAASFDAGEGPDLFNLSSVEISSLLDSGELDAVDPGLVGYDSADDLVRAYIDGAFEPVMRSGVVYGLPLEYTNWCLFVNMRILREHGFDEPPSTWEEVVEVSEALSERDGGILLERGFDFRYPYYLTFFVPMVRQLGGDVFAQDGSAISGTMAWEKALSFMKEWGPLGRNLGSPTYINARRLFDSEEIAMCLSGLYQESRMEGDNPGFFSSGDWAVAPFPVFDDAAGNDSSCVYCHFFLVNADSSDDVRDLAWSLAGSFTSHADDYLERIRLVMPLRSIISSEELAALPYSSVFLSDLERSRPVYSGPHAVEIQELIGEAVESVMLFSVPPEKAVQALRSSIEELD